MNKLTRTACFTDYHLGCKNNSELHNIDCMNYMDWFCNQAIKHKADNIIFCGDWFENRSAINVSTLNYSYLAAKKLNELNIPVFFVVGNHDLFMRHTREVFSTAFFQEFTNFTIINDPIIITDIVDAPLICPFLFPDEYPNLAQYLNTPVWFGHFEFKGFIVTGQSVIMKSGPDHSLFKGPKHIFSGHFHKRQTGGNVTYIGNTFPTNFSDANDLDRGMMIYDHISQEVEFLNWEDCPKYTTTTLSKLLDDDVVIYNNSRVRCVLDIPLSFEEGTVLKDQLVEQYQLREFHFEESSDIDDAITDTETDIDSEDTIYSIDDLVVKMLNDIDTLHIDNNILIEQYRSLK